MFLCYSDRSEMNQLISRKDFNSRMTTKKLQHGLARRTLLYGAAGICGIAIDTATFFVVESTRLALPIVVLNVLAYSLGTLTSYSINKQFSFRSETHRLSLRRYFLTSVFGMMLSTAILCALTQASAGVVYAKITATFVTALTQYAINTRFSLVSGKCE